MKRVKQIKRIAIGTTWLAVAALAAGCATRQGVKQALVCPQCQVVTVTRTVPVFDSDGNMPPTA